MQPDPNQNSPHAHLLGGNNILVDPVADHNAFYGLATACLGDLL